MEYPKIINLLDNTPNKLSKFRTKNWAEMNDDACGTYNRNSQIRFKTSMLKQKLCNYSDAYILVSGPITVVGAGADAAVIAADRDNKKVVFKNCEPLTDCITEINNRKTK